MAAEDGKAGEVSIDPRTAALGAEAGSLPLPIGTVLERGFVIRSVLGRGGFGVTYMAEHTGLGRRVALKEHFPEQFSVRQGLSVRPTSAGAAMFKWGLDRFLEEAKRLAQFKHPSIVDVTDVFEANGTAYMALAYEDGETLGQWLDGLGRPPTQAELDRILSPILDALEHVHGHDILHRDIAPDNIMLRRDGTPVLIDFGAARQAMAEKSQTLTGIVKHGYSPPEQYARSSARHGPWSDIYALGATLYRALMGAAPQDAPDRQIQDDVRDLAPLAARGYRPAFLTAIMTALALKPADRPQTVGAWRSELLAPPKAGPRPVPPQRTAPASRPASQPRQAAAPPSAPVRSRPAVSTPRERTAPPLPSGLLDTPPPRSNFGRTIGIAALVVLVAGGAYVAGQRTGPSEPPRTEIATSAPSPKSTLRSPTTGTDPALTVTPGSGQSFRDCPTCPEMVVVPAGTFVMGNANERPPHEVTLQRPFAVGKFEITFSQWDVCVADNGCTITPKDAGWGRGNRPVINVLQSHAKEYVAWLSRKTLKNYRLLTEAEWEYAARAGTTTKYSFGDTITHNLALFSSHRTVEVGAFPPNAWGIHDMHGNASEWVEDCWSSHFDRLLLPRRPGGAHPNVPNVYAGAPTDGSSWAASCRNAHSDQNDSVIRGGAWRDHPFALSVTAKKRGGWQWDPENPGNTTGFRVARTL